MRGPRQLYPVPAPPMPRAGYGYPALIAFNPSKAKYATMKVGEQGASQTA